MNKLITLLIIMFSVFTFTLNAQEAAKTENADSAGSAYSLIGVMYNFGYFATHDAKSAMGLVGKVKLDNGLGLEIGLGSLDRPTGEYRLPPRVVNGLADSLNTGSSNATWLVGKGIAEYTEASFNVLYYFWFLKELQVKMGLSYLHFIRGEVIVDAGHIGDGYILHEPRATKTSTFTWNLGFNIDLPIYQHFNLITSVGYKMFVDDKSGVLCIGMGLGYKI